MTISDGTILRIAVSLLFTDGNLAMNIFNAVITGTGAPWDEADVVTDAVTWMDTLYANMTSSVGDTLDGSEITVYEYDALDDDWDEVGTADFTWNPSSAGDPLPRGVAALVNVRTIDPDVSGKKYFAGWTEGSSTDGAWVAAVLTTLADVIDDWITPFAGAETLGTWAPVVWSVVSKTPYIMSGESGIPTEPAYQRRRKRGVGA